MILLFATATFASDLLHHDLSVRLDPDKGALVVDDRITLPKNGSSDPFFTLHAGLTPSIATPGVVLRKTRTSRGWSPWSGTGWSSRRRTCVHRYVRRTIQHPRTGREGTGQGIQEHGGHDIG